MKVVEFLESRREQWQELETLCTQLGGVRRRSLGPASVVRFAALYRAACADLALADAYQLPPATVDYLHQLIGRAHNQLYRAEALSVRTWFHELFVVVPQRLLQDRSLWLAHAIFWSLALLAFTITCNQPEFAEQLLGKEQIASIEDSFSGSVVREMEEGGRVGGNMVGFYIFHNISIGLQCFAFGLLFGIGGLYITAFNAVMLGAVFGSMLRSPHANNFFHFVTAHSPFELTAIVLCSAAGMRLGFSLVDTRGFRRGESLRRAMREASPTLWAAVTLFGFAALIEAFLSPSAAPYPIKAATAVLSVLSLLFYFFVLGYPRHGNAT